MTVRGDQIAALRAALTGDISTFERLGGTSGQNHGEEFPILVATAFIIAAQRRFPHEWSIADVIRFVGQVRVQCGDNYDDLSPAIAEQLILAALRDEPMGGEFDETDKAYTQFVLLSALVRDLDEQQLDMFLAESCEKADQWIAERA